MEFVHENHALQHLTQLAAARPQRVLKALLV